MKHTETQGIEVAFATLGCKVNQAESEVMMGEFAGAGYALTSFDGPADVYILNSCTVTHIADRKSRQLIRQARRHNPAALIAVTGCYAEIDGEEIASSLGIDLVVANTRKGAIVELVREKLEERLGRPHPNPLPEGEGTSDAPLPEGEGTSDAPLPEGEGARDELLTRGEGTRGSQPSTLDPRPSTLNPRTRAMVKVQDGCNNFCSYCIVPLARGRERSVPLPLVVDEVRRQVEAGAKEVVLTGVHAGAYGRGLAGPPTLASLVESVLAETAVERLRLSSIEPWDLEPALLGFLAEPRFCRHFHLSLQSGSDSVLRRMGRRYTAARFDSLVDQIRKADPDTAITTDVIVGFPGETEAEHLESLRFCREAGFAKMHVFRYSPRQRTRAAELPDQVGERVKKGRSEEMMHLAGESAARFGLRFIGKSLTVLWEYQRESGGRSARVWTGLSDNYLRVDARSRDALGNRLLPVAIVAEAAGGLWGKLIEPAALTTRS